jgi:hypothetical protein
MNKEIEKAAASALAEDINSKHAAIMALVDGVKDTAKEIGAMANEVGMALTSARDTIGPAFQHWLRENVTISTAVAERYIRHHAHYHPDQLFLPGFKMIEDRASVVAQAKANAEAGGEGDQPKADEVPDVSVRDIAAGWVYDARRWFSQLIHKLPPESMSAEQIEDTLRVVKPVRDMIWAYEKRLVALTGGQRQGRQR